MTEPVPETRHLKLRLLASSDIPDIQKAAAVRDIADTMISLPHPYPDGEAERYYERQQREREADRAYVFSIRQKKDGIFCGVIELRAIEREHSQGEISFWLAREAWGQGYMSEAVRAVVQYGFEVLGINRIYAHHMLRNPATGRVLEKNGFKQEGLLRQRVIKWGVFEDVALWAVLKSDWQVSGDPGKIKRFKQEKLKTAYSLSILVAVVAILASIGGLLISEIYRDSDFVASMWKWNDLVTLVVAIPMLIISMLLSRRGSKRARLIWMAMLNYMLYNYAFYLFGAAFNKLFLLYASLVALSIFALIFGLVYMGAREIGESFRKGRFYRWISGYMIIIVLGLSTVYIIQSFDFVFTGKLPEIVVKTQHPTSVVFGLDFTLLVPVFLLGGIWLWKGKAWGYVLASMSMVKGAAYTLVLTVVSFLNSRSATEGVSSEWPFWTLLTLGSMIAAFYLLNKLDE